MYLQGRRGAGGGRRGGPPAGDRAREGHNAEGNISVNKKELFFIIQDGVELSTERNGQHCFHT